MPKAASQFFPTPPSSPVHCNPCVKTVLHRDSSGRCKGLGSGMDTLPFSLASLVGLPREHFSRAWQTSSDNRPVPADWHTGTWRERAAQFITFFTKAQAGLAWKQNALEAPSEFPLTLWARLQALEPSAPGNRLQIASAVICQDSVHARKAVWENIKSHSSSAC